MTALLFARSGLYAERAAAPGPGADRRLAVPGRRSSRCIFAVVNGNDFSSYYIFYGSLVFAVAYVSPLRFAYERVTGVLLRAAGYQRRAVLVGTGEHIEDVAHALRDGAARADQVVGFISLDAAARQRAALARHARRPRRRRSTSTRVDEVIIADPDFPQQQAVELVDQCHQRGVRVRIAPSTMEILIHRAEFVPGQSVPLFELKPPVFEGVDFALKRTFDVVGRRAAAARASARCCSAIALAVRLTSRGPVLYRSMRARASAARRSPCLKFRTMYPDAEQRQADLEELNEATGALFKIRDDPRLTPVGRLLRRFSLDELPQLFNVAARRDVARRPAAAAPARLRAARGLAPEALPRAARASPGCGRSPAARSSTSTTSCASTSSTSSAGRSSST